MHKPDTELTDPNSASVTAKSRDSRATGRNRGQVLVLFALMLTFLLGTAAFVVDLAWIWVNELKVQRAADAAALAGVVHLAGRGQQREQLGAGGVHQERIPRRDEQRDPAARPAHRRVGAT